MSRGRIGTIVRLHPFPDHRLMPLTRFFVVWLVMAFVMTANGIFRESVLKRALGPGAAAAASALLGVALILLVTWFGFRPLVGATTAALVQVSLLLVAMTVAFEFAIGHFVDEKSWSELAANYAFWRGRLWPFVLLVLALTPFLWGRWLHTARQVAGAASPG